MLVDSHTHLNDENLFKDWYSHLKNFYDKWWRYLVNIWVDEFYNQRWIEICSDYEKSPIHDLNVWSTVWFHPFEVVAGNITNQNIITKVSTLREQYANYKKYIYAIWECWIDLHYSWAYKTLDLQKKLFHSQLNLAQELWLPVVIHSRDAFYETVDVLSGFKKLKIYFHCRWYWFEEVDFLQKNFNQVWIGYCGNVTYPKADNLRQSLQITNNFLLETDAPYLSPQKIRWNTNSPENIFLIYEFVSEYLNLSLKTLEDTVLQNFLKFYNK